jgi:NAD+ kinase
MKSIIYYRDDAKGPSELEREIRPYLMAKGVDVVSVTPRDSGALETTTFDDGSFVLSLGGDGTFLRAARLSIQAGLPVLGINLGLLGFLTDVEQHEVYASLDAVLAGSYSVERRLVLEARVVREGQDVFGAFAVNEVMLVRETTGKILSLEVTIGGVQAGQLTADGVLVATPTGSTGYCLSVGGPIVDPMVEALVIAALAPHDLTSRPLVVPASSEITLKVGPLRDGALFMRDGERIGEVRESDTVVVRRHVADLAILRLREKNFYKVLSTKFHWGT